MTREMRRALLGKETSRRNKMALLAQCVLDGERVTHRWVSDPYNSRLQLCFNPGEFLERWLTCQSFDEDVHEKMADNRPKGER